LPGGLELLLGFNGLGDLSLGGGVLGGLFLGDGGALLFAPEVLRLEPEELAAVRVALQLVVAVGCVGNIDGALLALLELVQHLLAALVQRAQRHLVALLPHRRLDRIGGLAAPASAGLPPVFALAFVPVIALAACTLVRPLDHFPARQANLAVQ